jgi:trehalose 6-phosphate phosphatase
MLMANQQSVSSTEGSGRDIDASNLVREIAADPSAFALFSDFDGTLVNIAGRPEDVVVPRHLKSDIRAVRALLGGAFAIVTGRTLAEVNRFLGKGLEASGLHGIQFSFPPSAGQAPMATEAPKALVEGIVKIVTGDPGLRLENKGPILAVHFRQAPAAGGWLRAGILDLIETLRLDHHIKEGRAVIEVMPRGRSKGTALLEFMRRTPYAGRIPIMIGDDRADEDAFAVARAEGGLGLRVAGEHFTRGDEPFAHAGEVRAWFAALAGRAA